MPNKEVVLGLDTSCYTTSVALMDLTGSLVADARRLLTVKPGHRGLAQSEMVFQHTRNLPDLVEQLDLTGLTVRAIGVSAKPRPREDSYMPAFLTGLGMARSLGKLLRVPVHRFTHQHNHMYAGLWSVGREAPDRFLLVHISGGTTDFLLCEKQSDGRFTLTPQGTSIDLHAGQFIDRVGVALGLPFPCGPHLEKLAEEAREPYPLKVWTQEAQLSLSGPCSQALRAVEKGADPASLALGVERAISRGLSRTLFYVCKQQELHQVLLAGGVSANGELRRQIGDYLQKRQIELWGPDPKYSVDGAVGNAWAAVLAERQAGA
ncbi:O-sialoglycoprotein endopeptidase [uncultured Acidaminococcus sp.]|uniref:Kae1-like domain-containing protein n=1 Tax=uncultured Acidaminococcus sp. TaxID=352152 RepID=UPI002594BFE3|nr:O-sialoglycoprotein endopeptidase [uncultured Acidaminococcus sp.]